MYNPLDVAIARATIQKVAEEQFAEQPESVKPRRSLSVFLAKVWHRQQRSEPRPVTLPATPQSERFA